MTNDERELGRLVGMVEAQNQALLRIERKQDSFDERVRNLENYSAGALQAAKVRGRVATGVATLVSSAIAAATAWISKGGPTP